MMMMMKVLKWRIRTYNTHVYVNFNSSGRGLEFPTSFLVWSGFGLAVDLLSEAHNNVKFKKKLLNRELYCLFMDACVRGFYLNAEFRNSPCAVFALKRARNHFRLRSGTSPVHPVHTGSAPRWSWTRAISHDKIDLDNSPIPLSGLR